MTAELTGLCRDHSFETAENICRRCGLEYCELCLVFPFGAKRPFCKECAMVAGGVRNQGAKPEMARREVRRRVKAGEARAKRMAAGTGTGAEGDPILNDPLAPTDEDLERVPAMTPAAEEDAAVAADLTESFSEMPSTNPPPSAVSANSSPAARETGEQPANGIAPPIDWSQPFG